MPIYFYQIWNIPLKECARHRNAPISQFIHIECAGMRGKIIDFQTNYTQYSNCCFADCFSLISKHGIEHICYFCDAIKWRCSAMANITIQRLKFTDCSILWLNIFPIFELAFFTANFVVFLSISRQHTAVLCKNHSRNRIRVFVGLPGVNWPRFLNYFAGENWLERARVNQYLLVSSLKHHLSV